MSDATHREMTLDEWCAEVHENHLVNRELRELREKNAELEAEIAELREKCELYDWIEERQGSNDNVFNMTEPVVAIRFPVQHERDGTRAWHIPNGTQLRDRIKTAIAKENSDEAG